MRDFTVAIQIEGQKKILLFKSVITPGGCKYFVSAFHNIENYLTFEMKERVAGQWKVTAPAPLWALRFEKQLSAAIVANNKF